MRSRGSRPIRRQHWNANHCCRSRTTTSARSIELGARAMWCVAPAQATSSSSVSTTACTWEDSLITSVSSGPVCGALPAWERGESERLPRIMSGIASSTSSSTRCLAYPPRLGGVSRRQIGLDPAYPECAEGGSGPAKGRSFGAEAIARASRRRGTVWCEMCTAWPRYGILGGRSVTHLSGLHVVTDGHVLVRAHRSLERSPDAALVTRPPERGSSGTTLRRRAGMLLAVSHG